MRCDWLRWLQPVAPSRFELGISILLVIFWCGIAPTELPRGPVTWMGTSIVVTLSFICVLNAVFDFRRMGIFERVAIIAWFPLITFVAYNVLQNAITTRIFADR